MQHVNLFVDHDYPLVHMCEFVMHDIDDDDDDDVKKVKLSLYLTN
jgi:hypothetical protein